MEGFLRSGPTIEAKGGASQYAHPADDAAYQAWKASVDAHPVYCGIPAGDLAGLWDLAGTEARAAELRQAHAALTAARAAVFTPLIHRITGLQLLDAGTGTTVGAPPTFGFLTSLAGDTAGGRVNLGVWNDTVLAHRIYLAVKEEDTATPTGLSGLHLASSDPAMAAVLLGAQATHDGTDGAGQPGRLANAAVDLSAGACAAASIREWYSGWCAFYFWDAACAAAPPPLQLHYTTQASAADAPIRCVVLGDAMAIDPAQPAALRQARLRWLPRDANQDGAVDAADADWVLAHVTWIPRAADGLPLNLNGWKQSYQRYDWYDCGAGQGYDDLWIHEVGAVADAQYLGYCLK